MTKYEIVTAHLLINRTLNTGTLLLQTSLKTNVTKPCDLGRLLQSYVHNAL